jgi:hypothetical protein
LGSDAKCFKESDLIVTELSNKFSGQKWLFKIDFRNLNTKVLEIQKSNISIYLKVGKKKKLFH